MGYIVNVDRPTGKATIHTDDVGNLANCRPPMRSHWRTATGPSPSALRRRQSKQPVEKACGSIGAGIAFHNEGPSGTRGGLEGGRMFPGPASTMPWAAPVRAGPRILCRPGTNGPDAPKVAQNGPFRQERMKR